MEGGAKRTKAVSTEPIVAQRSPMNIITAQDIINRSNQYRKSISYVELDTIHPDADNSDINNIIIYHTISKLRQVMNTPIFANAMDENNRRREITRTIVADADIWLTTEATNMIESCKTISKLSNKILIDAYNKYGYSEFLYAIKRVGASDIKQELATPNERLPFIRRYISQPPVGPTVYRMCNILDSKFKIKDMPTMTPLVVYETKTIDLTIKRPYLRYVDDETADLQSAENSEIFDSDNTAMSAFVDRYNATISSMIIKKIKRCSIITSNRRQAFGETLLLSLDYHKFIEVWERDGMNGMRDALYTAILKYLINGFMSLNSTVKNPKEVLLMSYRYILVITNDIVNLTIHNIRSIKREISETHRIEPDKRMYYVTLLSGAIKEAVNVNTIAKPIESLENNLCI